MKRLFVIALLGILFLGILPTAFAEVEVKPLIRLQTTDSIQQFVGTGTTFRWERVDLDVSHGVKRLNCAPCVWPNDTQQGTNITLRFYFIRSNIRRFRPFLSYQHTSDLFRGPPFNPNDQEPTIDFFGSGVTFRGNDLLEIDLAVGAVALDCAYLQSGSCPTEVGGLVSVRLYPFKTFHLGLNVD